MKRLDWRSWALLVAATILIMIAFAGFAIASECNPPLITLKPRENEIVEFKTDNALVLKIDNIAAPPELSSLITVTPSKIPEKSSEEVTIIFACPPTYAAQLIREGLEPKIYRVDINGLRVFLDMTEVPSENAETLQALIDALTQRVNELETLLEDCIAAQESAPEPENLMPELEALREDVMAEIEIFRENVRAELEKNENNPEPVGWEAALNNLELRLATNFADALADLRSDQERQRVADKSDLDEKIISYAAIISIIVTAISVTYLKKSKVIKKTFRGPPTPSKFEAVTDDQIAMIENEIKAMKERSESTKAKEIELEILKKRQELEKLGDE